MILLEVSDFRARISRDPPRLRERTFSPVKGEQSDRFKRNGKKQRQEGYGRKEENVWQKGRVNGGKGMAERVWQKGRVNGRESE